jgi:hypothetical protein
MNLYNNNISKVLYFINLINNYWVYIRKLEEMYKNSYYLLFQYYLYLVLSFVLVIIFHLIFNFFVLNL